MTTIKSSLDDGVRIMKGAGVESPRMEARLLLAHASGLSVATLMGYPERVVENDSLYRQLVSRRAARDPLSHRVGRREFWSLSFKVTADTLDPRPDSETIVEAALDGVSDRSAPLRILDLGTGTGCLLVALLSELPAAFGVGVDQSVAATRVAAENTAALGFEGRAAFVVGDWGQAVSGGFDLIVSNPPYIPREDIDGLELEVSRYEPRLALAGGEDGLTAYRAILSDIPRFLSPGGVVVFEIGADQAGSVTALAQKAGLQVFPVRSDLASRDRCLVCRKG